MIINNFKIATDKAIREKWVELNKLKAKFIDIKMLIYLRNLIYFILFSHVS